MTAAEAIRDFIAPLLPNWALQYGAWSDTQETTKRLRFAVLKPVGGSPAEMVRRPLFTLALIGMDGGDIETVSTAANAVVQAMRSASGRLVQMQASEPVYSPTTDSRPVFEIAIAAITT